MRNKRTAVVATKRASTIHEVIVGSCLRCDREMLRAALAQVADLFGVTEERVLAEWVVRVTEFGPADAPLVVAEVERLFSREMLEVLAFKVAHTVFINDAEPSRAN